MRQWAQRTMASEAALASAAWRRAAAWRAWAFWWLRTRETNRTARMMTAQSRNLPKSASLQDDFQDEPAARVGQQQEGEAGQRPAQGDAAAPARAVLLRQLLV